VELEALIAARDEQIEALIVAREAQVRALQDMIQRLEADLVEVRGQLATMRAYVGIIG
jgi:hypothetical protein